MVNNLKSQRGLGPIIVALVIVGILVLAGGIYWWQKSGAPLEPGPSGPGPSEPTAPEVHKDYKQAVSRNFAYSDSEQDAMDVPGGLALSYYFNKDNKDNTYIFSQTTGDIRAFDSNGNLKFTFNPVIPATEAIGGHKAEYEISASDFIVDKNGNIDVLFSIGIEWFLARFSPAGEFQEKIGLDDLSSELRKKETAFDWMYLADNKIYAKYVGGHSDSYLIGRIEDGNLEKVEPLSEFQGVLGSTSGNWYEVKITERHRKGIVRILDSSGTELQTITIEREGLASIIFLGEDQDGNIYVQVERSTAPAEIELEVHKFDPEGNRLTVVNIPNNDYTLWSNKLLLLGEDGAIWQVIPAEDGWYINKWSNIY